MRFDDEQSVDMINPQFNRKDLRRLEQHSIRQAFDTVTTVVDVINDGKEATVYLCETTNGELAAAKIYRAQKFRAFNNAKNYVDTRAIPDRRVAKAIRKGTQRGKTMGQLMWVNREWDALQILYDEGASVPEPLAHSDVGILMEYLGDEHQAAPTLVEMKLTGDVAAGAWRACLRDVEHLLDCDLIHGDLSGYNVLWWQGRPRLIDLPQAVDYRNLGNAFELLHRDIANLAKSFPDLGADPIAIAGEFAARYL
ncbi:MAG: serine protein kinase RIO [Gammaproteobacteria bacterium]|nr:serine protein kinase RIO [Gammaproteobacteria bacterium]